MATAATLSSTPAAAPTTTSHDNPATRPITSIPRGPVPTTLTYYSPPVDGSSPFNYVETPPPGQRQRNYTESPHAVTVSDARGQESRFSTDEHGFALLTNVPVSAEREFVDDASIAANYYPEVDALLRKELGADRVVIFDHTIRRSQVGAKRAPVNRVHIDQTAKAARQRVQRHAPEDAERLLEGRVRIVNVWRPLNGPVVSSPLAMADSNSVSDDAVVPVEHRYPDRTGETAGIKAEEGHRWWYWSGMGNEERILLQCYDSKLGKRVAHTAFTDKRTEGPEWRGRESIEVRALVFG
ncbi:hypothetical protein K461DRAFT_260532 [Myriangium duriaei CBS 260.36]|uniref:Methyltransferase n=1 Tax=Myriangium duriaei CBS 260.36 TaxID=1168546 RepID=A0A9P4MCW6_9PEZI|nr:hypothetical protein K461DRAFT_260532 [Myriangium duriaei CBS 260.36]